MSMVVSLDLRSSERRVQLEPCKSELRRHVGERQLRVGQIDLGL